MIKSIKPPKYSKILTLLEFFFTTLPSFIILNASIQYLFHETINIYTFPIAIAIGIAASLFLLKDTSNKLFKFAIFFGIAALVLLCGFLLSRHFLDISYDGQSYHLLTSLVLGHGWNPFYIHDAQLFVTNNNQTLDWLNSNCLVYSTQYPKAAEMIIAAINTFGHKIVNPLFIQITQILAIFLVAFRLFSQLEFKKYLRICLSLIISLNPVILAQLASNYVDGWMAFANTIFILEIMGYIYFNDKLSLFIAGLVAILIINIKITGIVDIVIYLLGYGIYLLFHKRQLIFNAVSFLLPSVIVGFVIVGYQPYMTNIIDNHSNPFYPFVLYKQGHISVDNSILLDQANTNFTRKNRFEAFFISMFSTPNTISYKNFSDYNSPELHFPFPFQHYQGVDIRFAGFGPTFGVVLLVSLLLLFFVEDKLLIASCIIILFSVFVLEGAWWARYVPQLWLIPPLILTGIILRKKILKFQTITLNILLGLLLINPCFMLPILGSFYQAERDFLIFTNNIKKSDNSAEIANPLYNNIMGTNFTIALLRDYGVNVELQPVLTCPAPQVVPYSLGIKICLVSIR